MKKSIRFLLLAATALCGSAIVSCHKSNEALIEEVNSLAKESKEARIEYDKKFKDIQNKLDKIRTELEERNLTEEETSRLERAYYGEL